MSHRTLSFSALLAVLLLGTVAFAQVPTREFAPVQNGPVFSGETVSLYREGRVLVKFAPAAATELALRVSQLGRAVPTATTGIASVDQAVAPFRLSTIETVLKVEPRNRTLSANVGADRWYALDFESQGDMAALARQLAADPNVEEATPDWRAFPSAIPNDPLHADHWGHNNTVQLPGLDWGGTYEHTLATTVGTAGFDANAQAAWDVTFGVAGIVIAIIDSGVDTAHPDLRLVPGYDYGDNDSNPMDNSAAAGHGTACAGVAAAIANNGIGVAGIAGGASIMPLKVANSAGSMYFSAIVNAIYHAADNGADVISMSLGAAISSDSATDAAILYAYNAGVTILAATGNENASTISYPAINTYVIGVGAASPCGERKRSSSSTGEVNPGVSTDPNGYTCDGERWWGSNYGSTTRDAAGAVDILGPTILPTTDISGSAGYDPGNYDGFFNGTSCATPYVAGVAALVKSLNPTWSPAQVRAQLVNNAQDVTSVESGAGWDRYAGYGMVDAAATVGAGSTPTAPTAAFNGTPTSGTFPLVVQFTDASSGTPTSWSWNFGDGGSSSSQNPSHTYNAAGSFTVTLTASNAQGSDGETKVGYITVTDPANTFATLPYSTSFESGALDTYWVTTSSPEGRILITTANTPRSGSYHLTMDDSINGGLYGLNEAWLQLDLGGESQVDLDFWWKEYGDETHAQDGVFFSSNGGASFVQVLAFNNGAVSNNVWRNAILDVDAVAAANGLTLTSNFVVKFQQYDNYAIATDGMAFDDITVTGGPAGSAPVAAFAASTTSGTAPLTVTFTDASTNAPTAWSWNFGDGGTSTTQSPAHTYTTAGTYTVSLIASNAYGSDTETKTGYITVTAGGGGGIWETLTYDDFEGGMGSYTDGGADMARYTGGTYAHQGSAAANIQDNSGTASSFFHTASYDVSAYVDLEVEFWFRGVSMDTNEDFWVQFFDGSVWRTVATFRAGVEFVNNTFYNAVVTIPAATYNYPANAKLRFLCDASGNADDVYIDEIEFRGLTAGGAQAGIANETPKLPTEFGIAQNHPNPFNPITQIDFALPSSARVAIDVFDLRGRRVATLADGTYEAGLHSIRWDASTVASGTYFYRIVAGEFTETRKMTLIK